MNLKVKDKVILTCDEADFENQESRRDCINKIVTIKEIYYHGDNIDTFFVEENKYEWVPENIVIKIKLSDEKETKYFPIPYVDHSITSQDFKSWLQSIDDDETEIEDLHLEYLAEVKANKH